MNALLAFAAALVSLRLAAELLRRSRSHPTPELLAWGLALAAYAVAAGAIAAGAAGGWHNATFRVYYLFGGLLTAPLFGIGSLLRVGVRRAASAGLVYAGLAVGVAVAAPLRATVAGSGIPHAQDYLDLFPARLLAIAANSIGTLAVLVVALSTYRRRPVGNGLVVLGIGAAAAGSGISSLGEGAAASMLAAAALLLYAGVASVR
jgi:hypothetical protein